MSQGGVVLPTEANEVIVAKPEETVRGLSPQHHKELNGGDFRRDHEEEQQIARLAELRSQYANDPVALQQIDVYDYRTEYHVKFAELRNALISNDTKAEAELSHWFEVHYPDLEQA